MIPGCAICSDLHLDAKTDGVDRFPEIAGATTQVAAYVEKSDLEFLAILGDVANPGPLSYRALAYLVALACQLQRQGRKLVLLVGNHDLLDDGGSSILEPLDPLPNVTLVSRPTFFE